MFATLFSSNILLQYYIENTLNNSLILCMYENQTNVPFRIGLINMQKKFKLSNFFFARKSLKITPLNPAGLYGKFLYCPHQFFWSLEFCLWFAEGSRSSGDLPSGCVCMPRLVAEPVDLSPGNLAPSLLRACSYEPGPPRLLGWSGENIGPWEWRENACPL